MSAANAKQNRKHNRILNSDVDSSLLVTSDVINPGILLAYFVQDGEQEIGWL